MSIAEAFSREPLHGRRILIVEDIAIIAYGFEDILKGAGAEVVGPALQLKVAERLAGDEKISGTLLDIRLNGDEVWSVAPLLDRKGACLSSSPQGILTGTACRRNGADGRFSSNLACSKLRSAVLLFWIGVERTNATTRFGGPLASIQLGLEGPNLTLPLVAIS